MDEIQFKKENPNGFTVYIRGIGNDFVDCFCCKEREHGNGCNHNIAMIVLSKEDGEKIEEMFEFGCRFVCRPNRIQIKIGACTKHLSNLEYLSSKISQYGYFLPKYISESRSLSLDVGLKNIDNTIKKIKSTIKLWLETDYCCYHIPIGDTLNDHIKQAKSDLDNLLNIIIERKLDTESDRGRHNELICCKNQKLKYQDEYDEGYNKINCESCGTNFWYHGSWQKRTKDGWELQFQPPQEATIKPKTKFSKKIKGMDNNVTN